MLIEPINVMEKKAAQAARADHYSSQLAVISNSYDPVIMDGDSDQASVNDDSEGDEQCIL